MPNDLPVDRPRRSVMGGFGVAAAVLILAAPQSAASQTPLSTGVMAGDRAGHACVDTMSNASLPRLTLYQHAVVTDTTPAMQAQSALVSQHIAEAARVALGAAGDSLPAGDSLGVWRTPTDRVPVVIVIYRDRPWTWRPDGADDTAAAKLGGFYARVLRSIPRDSLWMVWPDGDAVDSVAMHLDVTSDNPGRLAPSERAMVFPVFIAKGLVFQPAGAMMDRYFPGHYPVDAMLANVTLKVSLQVVIGADGRADPSTIRVVEPSTAVMDTSHDARYYREFVDATRDQVIHQQYRPARVGGCPVRQLVSVSTNYGGIRASRPN